MCSSLLMSNKLLDAGTEHHTPHTTAAQGLPCKNRTLLNDNIVSGHTEILQNFHVAKLIFLIFLIDSFCLPVQISVEPPLPYLDCQLLESCNRPAPGGSCLCSGSISTVYSRSPPRCTVYSVQAVLTHTHIIAFSGRPCCQCVSGSPGESMCAEAAGGGEMCIG